MLDDDIRIPRDSHGDRGCKEMRKRFRKLFAEQRRIFDIVCVFRPCFLYIGRDCLSSAAERHDLKVLPICFFLSCMLIVIDIEDTETFGRIGIDGIPSGNAVRICRKLCDAFGKSPRIRRQHAAPVMVIVDFALSRFFALIVNAVDSPLPDVGECHVADLCAVHLDTSLP